MDKEIVRGLALTVLGTEIISMCERRITELNKDLTDMEEASVRIAEMSPEARRIAGIKVSGDMGEAIQTKIERARKDRAFFAFLAEHTEPETTYRLGVSELAFFGIHEPRRY